MCIRDRAPALSQQIPANLAATRDDALRAVPANVQLFRASLAQASGDLPATVAHAKRALATAAPVSYTHLDVYKRQPLHR